MANLAMHQFYSPSNTIKRLVTQPLFSPAWLTGLVSMDVNYPDDMHGIDSLNHWLTWLNALLPMILHTHISTSLNYLNTNKDDLIVVLLIININAQISLSKSFSEMQHSDSRCQSFHGSNASTKLSLRNH